MRVVIGADYRGFESKKQLIEYLMKNQYEVTDVGAFEYNEGDDFNDPAVQVALDIRENPEDKGILICDSAHGMTIQANRFLGVRAAHCDSVQSAVMAREHDDANVVCLSAHFIDADLMKEIVHAFLTTDFTPLERRMRRINRLDERGNYD